MVVLCISSFICFRENPGVSAEDYDVPFLWRSSASPGLSDSAIPRAGSIFAELVQIPQQARDPTACSLPMCP